MSDAWTYFDNPLAPNEDFPGCDHFSRFNIEQPGGVEDDRMRLSLREGDSTAEYCKGQDSHNGKNDSVTAEVLSRGICIDPLVNR
jgi:hypothetical protein